MRDFLMRHGALDPVSFHMPGHKGSAIFRRYGYGDFIDRLIDCDITEIAGADNLFQAEGIIEETQKKYARLYDVERSYLLINGTSGGLIASILAAVKPGGKLIMARNCHKSVFNALTLGNIQPVYAQPEQVAGYGISGAVSPDEIKRCVAEAPDAGAVILPSPNYYGICSDIRAIADIVHEAGKILIVDQAHGAHLKFFRKFGYGEGMPQAAEDSGADIIVNSIHKTLAALTQSAVLNLNSSRVDRYVLEDKLQAVQSSSPSYVLMGFLDVNADLLAEHGRQAIGEWRENIDAFRAAASEIGGLRLITTDNMDITKIDLDMGALGIDGAVLDRLLMERDIFSELHTGDILMLMTGIGNTREHMERTLDALRQIAAESAGKADVERRDGGSAQGSEKACVVPVPGELHEVPADKELVSLEKASGRICAGSIIPYPPGIPLVCPGEEITEGIVGYVKALRDAGENVIGINDRGQVLVGRK